MITWKDRVFATVLAVFLAGAVLCAGVLVPVSGGETIAGGAQGASKQRFDWLIANTLSVQNTADFMGSCIDLDAASTTSICADTDNQIDVEINGADDFKFTANTFTALAGSTIAANTIAETTSGSGVTIDGLTIKDGGVAGSTGGLTVTGDSDEIQLKVTGYTTQTNSLAVFEQSDGTDVVTISNAGMIGAVDLSASDDLAVTDDATVGGTVTAGSHITITAVSDGGNKGAKNQYYGLPQVKLVAVAQGTNPGSETVDCMDSTPTGEWTEVDAGTNITVTADTDYYRYDTNSVKLQFADVVENDGVSVALPAQDDLSGLESVGFWIYSDVAISSGDLDLTVDDSDGTDQVYNVGAVITDTWTWVEVDISGCDANCDTADNFIILATAQGAAALGAANIYIDELFYWDSVDEDALGTAILRDGVLSCVDTEGGVTLAEYTDYIVHEESGNDFIVYITDQSAADVVCLLAY